MKRRSRSARPLTEELRNLLNRWDPIGCGPPPDEYDCLLTPLLGKLKAGWGREFVEKFLSSFLRSHFGLSPASCRVGGFAAVVCAWYAGRIAD